jgi:hypothetical protein
MTGRRDKSNPGVRDSAQAGGEFPSPSREWTSVRRNEFGVLPGKSLHFTAGTIQNLGLAYSCPMLEQLSRLLR